MAATEGITSSTVYAGQAAEFALDAASEGIYETISDDAVRLENAEISPEALINTPLWPSGSPKYWPYSMEEFRKFLVGFGKFSSQGFSLNDDWLFWFEWLGSTAAGHPAFNLPKDIALALEKRISLGDGQAGFWDFNEPQNQGGTFGSGLFGKDPLGGDSSARLTGVEATAVAAGFAPPSEAHVYRSPEFINAQIAGWVREAKELQKSIHAAQGYLNESILPTPFPAVSQFEQGRDGKIVVVADPVSAASGRTDEDLRELYQEARAKILTLAALGKNRLGTIESAVVICAEHFPENIDQVSSNRIWSKVNTIRGILELHQTEIAKQQDMRDISVILDATVASHLSDAVKQSNLFIAFDAKGHELDRLAYGPETRQRDELALKVSQPIILHIGEIADKATVNIIVGDHNNVVNASKTIHGDQAVERVVQQESNFYVRVLLISLRIMKAISLKGASESVSQVVAAVAGKYGGVIFEFIAAHQQQLHKVAAAFGFGPEVQNLIDIIAETAKLLS